VVAQPFDQCVGRRILEKIKNMMRCGIDQDGAVAPTAAESELIESQFARRLNWRLG
jgi:hypothetical protein